MPQREDGEFELVLGNKQLFSVLFIFVILLGVFFAMGFLAGRGTSPAPQMADATRPAPDAEPAAAQPVERQREAPARVEPEPPPPAPVEAVDELTPPPGRYLQAVALERRLAEEMLVQLSKQGMRGALAVSPRNPNLIRVLVGPLESAADIAAAREDLKKLNIEKPFLVEYK